MAQSSISRPFLGAIILGSIVGTGFLVKAAVDNLTAGHPTGGGSAGEPAAALPTPRSPRTPRSAPRQPAIGGGFPLKPGHSGALVKMLQEAIILRGGVAASEIINAGGADGRYGPATVRALAALGEPSTRLVTEEGFRRVTGIAVPSSTRSAAALPAGNSSSSANLPTGPLNLPNFADPNAGNTRLSAVAVLRGQLTQAVARYDVAGTVACIRAMQNVAGYRAVNVGAYGFRWDEPGLALTVRKSIVTRLGEVFAGNEAIRNALVKIGLTYGADGRWSAPF